MYEINIQSGFSAAHSLRGYRGKCEELHGHNWKAQVTVSSEKLDKLGMVIDFRKLKKKLARVLKDLDHKHLNTLPYFKKNNPTSEGIARYIFEELKSQKPLTRNHIKKVTIWETDTACASYAER